jgi:integrase
VKLAAFSGVRREEACQLRVRHIQKETDPEIDKLVLPIDVPRLVAAAKARALSEHADSI